MKRFFTLFLLFFWGCTSTYHMEQWTTDTPIDFSNTYYKDTVLILQQDGEEIYMSKVDSGNSLEIKELKSDMDVCLNYNSEDVDICNKTGKEYNLVIKITRYPYSSTCPIYNTRYVPTGSHTYGTANAYGYGNYASAYGQYNTYTTGFFTYDYVGSRECQKIYRSVDCIIQDEKGTNVAKITGDKNNPRRESKISKRLAEAQEICIDALKNGYYNNKY